MERPRLTYHHAYRLLVAVFAVSWLVAASVSVYTLGTSYQRARHSSEVIVANLSLSLENFLRVHFSVAEVILNQAARRFAEGTAGVPGAAEFSAELGRLQRLLPDTSGVRAADEQGRVIYGVDLPPGEPLSVASRKFFSEAQARRTLVFGLPLKSRVSGEWVLPVARFLQKPDGSFGGVVYINTELNAIARVFRSVDAGRYGSIALFDSARRVYLRFPVPHQLQDEQELRFDAPETRNAIAQGLTEAVYQTTSSIDGIERTVGFRRVGNYPLYVLFGVGKDEYLAEWRKDLRKHIAFLGLLAILGVAISFALKRSWRSQDAALAKMLLKDAELQRSLDALVVSEERFRTLTESLPQLSWVANRERSTQYLSSQWAAFTGRPLATLLANEGWLECVHPDDRFRIGEAWAQASACQAATRCQVRIRRHDGLWRTFEIAGGHSATSRARSLPGSAATSTSPSASRRRPSRSPPRRPPSRPIWPRAASWPI